MPKAHRLTHDSTPAKESKARDTDHGMKVIRIPRSELYKDPFRYVTQFPTMKGEKTPSRSDED
jgi:hypothetical protein